jgi:hypothetical protein
MFSPYLVFGVVCCVLLGPSHDVPNFCRGLWRGWATELCPHESCAENVRRPCGFKHTKVVTPIVVPWYLAQSVFVFRPHDEAIPPREGLHYHLREIRGQHLLACPDAMLPIDDEECSIHDWIPICWLLLCVRHYAKYLLRGRVWHMTEVVQRLVHSLLLVLPNSPVLWGSNHLVNRYRELFVDLKDKAVLAFWPELLIHCLCLVVICLFTQFKWGWNFGNGGRSAKFPYACDPHLLGCRWHCSWLWRFEFDGTIILLRVVEGPCPEDTALGGIGRADPMLPPWLVTFPVSSIALICLDICLLLAVMTSRLTISCLTLEAMALNPKGCPSLFSHSLLSTWASISFIRAS